MKVLVIGATGRVASHVTNLLLAARTPIRVLVRHGAKAKAAFLRHEDARLEIVDGPLDDKETLRRAFEDIDVAFQALGNGPNQVPIEKGLIDVAARMRVGHVVRLSILGADRHTIYEMGRAHGELDAYLAASGVPHTFLRPSYFTSNLLGVAGPIASEDRWYGLAPTGRVAAIDPLDVAAAAATVIRGPRPRNEPIELTGFESLTFPEMAERLGAVLGRPIRYVTVEEPILRRAMASRSIPEWKIDMTVGFEKAMEAGLHAEVSNGFRSITGKPPRPIDDFIRENRIAFRPISRTIPSW